MLVSRYLWFITGEPLLTCNISTEPKEVKSFLNCGKHSITLQQGSVFAANGVLLCIVL